MAKHNHNHSTSPDQIVTAVDYLASQEALKSEALETLPYDPTECSATTLGDTSVNMRQNLYACLTCRQGVCYSCSIQCHPGANHELVELFSKRGYACSCPPDRCILKKKHRRASVSSTSSDISKSNKTGNVVSSNSASLAAMDKTNKPMKGHNFRGLFCACDQPYNPDIEDRLMVQCCFGTACDEDWFHDSCIIDWISGNSSSPNAAKNSDTDSVVIFLSDPVDDLVQISNKKKPEMSMSASTPVENNDNLSKQDDVKGNNNNNAQESTTMTPMTLITKNELSNAAGFVCWNCVRSECTLFDLIFSVTDNKRSDITISDKDDGTIEELMPIGRRIFKNSGSKGAYFVIFDDPSYKARLLALAKSNTLPPLTTFMSQFPFFFNEETTYTPPLDTDASDDEAALLNTIPREQAIEGLKALDGIRTSLTAFLRGFVEGDRVVTEDDVTSFFENERKRKKAKYL